MSNYLNRISQSADEAKKSQAKTAAAGAKALVEQKISSLKAQAATLEAAYEDALGSNPFNVDKVINITNQKAENTTTLELVQGIYTTEFAD